MSTPEKHEPDQKTTPQQDQPMPAEKPEQQGDNDEKTAQNIVDAGVSTVNLASKSIKSESWKGIG